VTREDFDGLVEEALATIPERFRDALQNIAIVVEDEPSSDLLDEMEIEPPDTLLGLYQGTPLTERSWGYGNTLPDRVLLFQGPHERESEDEAARGASLACCGAPLPALGSSRMDRLGSTVTWPHMSRSWPRVASSSMRNPCRRNGVSNQGRSSSTTNMPTAS